METLIMKKNYYLLFIICCLLSPSLLFLVSCGGGKKVSSPMEPEPLRYATNLTCERGDGFSVWTLRDPWDTTQVLHRYILIPNQDQDPPPALPVREGAGCSEQASASQASQVIAPSLTGRAGSGSSVIKVPVRTAGVATAVHCGLLDELGVASAIAGVCEKEYIDLPAVTEGLAAGRIADFGNGMNPNIERIMDVAPDILMLTPFEHSGGYGRVERLGIPIIECAEYMEVSPLARAEWIRFYAELFGAEAVADSIFSAVESNYLELKEKVSAKTSSLQGDAHHAEHVLPTLLTEMLYGGQWFVPCGQSTMGMMFADAGADYLFADSPGSGSTALAFETVLDCAADADVWLVKYNSAQPLTYRQLAADYQPYTRFRAFREHHIWGCDLARNHFYEETPFHPDRLLRDLIIIAHPELMPGDSTTYYTPLKE